MTISIPMVDIMHAEAHAKAMNTPPDPHLSAIAASLAGGMIAASGRPHSVHEAIALWHSIHYAIDEQHGHDTPHRAAWDAHKKLDDPYI